jgi:hypothetical protein
VDLLKQEQGSSSGSASRYIFRFRPNGTGVPDVKQIFGNFITGVTYSGTGTGIYLVQFSSNHGSLIGFNASVQSNATGPAQGFTFEVDTAQTNLTAGTPGAVLAIAGVNASGTRATIASDANTWILCEAIFSDNTVESP